MPGLCVVPGCSKRGGHKFPSDETLKKKWIIAIRRDKWVPNCNSRVCHAHFVDSDYKESTVYGTPSCRKVLKPDSIPSKFFWTSDDKPSVLTRRQRAKRRAVVAAVSPSPSWTSDIDLDVTEEVVECTETDSDCVDLSPRHYAEVAVQTEVAHHFFCLESIVCDDRALQYYTGLPDIQAFSYVLTTLGHAAYNLNYRWGIPKDISVENQFLLTLMKLRLHSPNKELSILFRISETVVSNVFVTWVNFMYVTWKKINIWPSKELVQFYMPLDFRKQFPNTRLIIDGVEIPIKKPSKPEAQQVTFSTYKNRNTLKAVIGISPGGLVSHIPECYGGSASDRVLVERGDLTTKMTAHDAIMTDKGFQIQDLFAHKDVTVNTPSFLRKRNQFSTKCLKKDKKISSKRVHVERVIGLAKTYKILCTPLNAMETALGSRILFCCFMLCNYRRCIVPRNA